MEVWGPIVVSHWYMCRRLHGDVGMWEYGDVEVDCCLVHMSPCFLACELVQAASSLLSHNNHPTEGTIVKTNQNRTTQKIQDKKERTRKNKRERSLS